MAARQTSGTGGLYGAFIYDVDEQVDDFLSSRTANASTLYVVFSGANDLINGQTNVNVPVSNLAEDIGRLVAAGTRQFLVPNLPLLGFTPRFNSNSATSASTTRGRRTSTTRWTLCSTAWRRATRQSRSSGSTWPAYSIKQLPVRRRLD